MHMNEAERKLEAYRNRKKREILLNHYKTEVKNMFTSFLKREQNSKVNGTEIEGTKNLLEPSIEPIHSDLDSNDEYIPDSNTEEASILTTLDYLRYFLYFILWVTIYVIFIKLEFGMVYLVISGLIGIYLNTRTRPKMNNEVSAYSVFNKNCESIDGTLDADKLTKQMIYGGLAR